MPADYKNPHSAVSLNVLPHSGKVDQLKQEIASQPTVARTPVASNAATPAASDDPGATLRRKLIEGKVIEVIRKIFDPEIPVNIYDLGLIYEINVDDANKVNVKMTLTAPACPVAESLPLQVEATIQAIPEVTSANVELVWDPPWDRSRMSEEAMLALNMF